MARMGKKCSAGEGASQVDYSTDDAAVTLYSSLLRDFQATWGDDFLAGSEDLLTHDISAFRDFVPKELGIVSPQKFKAQHQMVSLLKKYRFKTDKHDDAELEHLSFSKYLGEQVRLCTPQEQSFASDLVCRRARKIAKRILGEFSEQDMYEHVRFGRKSSIGCPLRDAYIDIKLSMGEAFTGTVETTKFFDAALAGDQILGRILANMPRSEKNLSLDYLNLVGVPKTWKTLRLITPLSLLGLYYSYGVGGLVEERLKLHGLDISSLQRRHAKLVQSMTDGKLRLVTADLSAASDSITSELLNRVLPRPWYVALRKTFVRQVVIDGTRHYSASVLPMGNGSTFPVETLVFYCLLQAVAELSSVRGLISVYGDDCIYPTKLHKYVAWIFPKLRLVLNVDKTYVSYPFRESCGTDYYRSTDVRPYFLKGQGCTLKRGRYLSFLYKVYNGLLARWDVTEIPITVTNLLRLIAQTCWSGIHRVPPSFPEISGIRVEHHSVVPLNLDYLPWLNVKTEVVDNNASYIFQYLQEEPQERRIRSVEPYYWLKLQGLSDDIDPSVPSWHGRDFIQPGFTKRALVAGILQTPVKPPPRPSLSWKVRDIEVRGRKKRRCYPTVACKQRTRLWETSTLSKHTSSRALITDWS